MNPRVKQLAEQAGGLILSGSDIEKFAESIVQECSRIADDWVNNEDNGKNYPSDKIKQHFGVK